MGEYTNKQFAKDLWHFYSLNKFKFILFSSTLAISVILGLLPPIFTAEIIDIFTSDNVDVNKFYFYLGAMLVVGLVFTILRLRSKYWMNLYLIDVMKHAKIESFQKLMEGSLIWHDKESTGSKMQKLSSGVLSLKQFMKLYNNDGLNQIVNLIGVLVIFAILNFKYAIMALIYIVIFIFVEVKMKKKVAQKRKIVQEQMEHASSKAYDFSTNISTIKSLGINKSSIKNISEAESKLKDARIEGSKANNANWITIQIINVIFNVIFIFVVGNDILNGTLSVGSIVIYIDYLSKLSMFLITITKRTAELIDIKYALHRMMKIYRSIPEVEEEDAKPVNTWKELRVENLGFKYKDNSVIENITFSVKRGEKIGLVGRSGSGKSTLFKLLLKLYLPKKGMIYFDDKPINKITRDSILDKISIVMQETEVFNMTLKENILISNPGRVDYDLYKKSLVVSQVSKYISKLKNKDMSKIGEKGLRLSGGERQRLGIARALYKNSDIIIMDEATSSLDMHTEKAVQKELDKLKGKTLIISAHRLSTLRNMDKIIVMNKGKIIEIGSFNQLIRKKGYFYKLHKAQKK